MRLPVEFVVMSFENISHGVAVSAAPLSSNAILPSPREIPQRSPATAGGRRFSRRTRSLLGVQIVSCGSYVPDTVVTNSELAARFGFDADWITQRTGIEARRHARPDQATSDLCIEAARKAIRAARVNPTDIDLGGVGTFTPAFSFPSTACIVQDNLDPDAPAVHLRAACAEVHHSLT